MLPVVRLFGLTVATGPLLSLIAFWVGEEVGGRTLERLAHSPIGRVWRDAFSSASLFALLAGLVAARLGYAFSNVAVYISEPGLLFSLRPETLAPVPGLLAGFLALAVVLRRKSVPFVMVVDAVAVAGSAALALLAIRDYLVGVGYGMPVSWWTSSEETWRHPVQLYEAAFLFLLILVLWFTLPDAQPGQTFWRFVLGYSLNQLIVDAVRGGSWLLVEGVRGIQVVALAGALVAIYVLSFYDRLPRDAPKVQTTGGQPKEEEELQHVK